MLALACAGLPAQEPAERTYVRRIEFEGFDDARDEVLRRELIQLEAAVLNTVALDESLRRLRQLPFVADARATLQPVPEAPDLVDVVITIAEAPARRYGAGGGWSESQRGSLHAYYTDTNLLGTGQQLSFEAEASSLRSVVELAHTVPHPGAVEISRTVELSSRSIERLTAEASPVEAELDSVSVEYGYPLAGAGPRALPPTEAAREAARARARLPSAEVRDGSAPLGDVLDALRTSACCASIQLGAVLRRAQLEPFGTISDQLRAWLTEHRAGPAGPPTAELDELAFTMRWRHDTRDRPIFPEAGIEQTLRLTVALPLSDAEYGLLDYEIAAYRPLGERWTAQIRGRLGFGAAYGDEISMPPFLNWFAGGPLTVRGYRENTLGPRDSLGNPYGGNLLTVAQLELLTPWPPRWRERVRVGFFADVGNVFSTEDTAFTDVSERVLDYGFDTSALRASAGALAQVLTPFGALQLSYAAPIGAEDDHPNPFLRDRIERFQVSIGVNFR